MKNRYWVILIIFLIVIIGLGVYFSIKNNTNNQQSEYEANKTSSNSPNNTSENDTTQSNEENNKKMLNLTQTQKILILQITILTKLLKTLKNSLKALRLQQQKKLNLHHFQLKFTFLILLGKTIFK